MAERTGSRCLTNKRGFNETYRELLRMVRFCRNVTCFCWRPVLSDPTGNIKTIQDNTKLKILFTDKVARYVGKISDSSNSNMFKRSNSNFLTIA